MTLFFVAESMSPQLWAQTQHASYGVASLFVIVPCATLPLLYLVSHGLLLASYVSSVLEASESEET